MSSVLIAFLILFILGLLLSIGLFIAEKKLSVEKDEKLKHLEEVLPGANCGGCGFAGCSDYANAVFSGNAKIGLCAPGGQDVADKMGSILGEKVEKVEKLVAYAFCDTGCSNSIKSFKYDGINDCNAAAMLFNGDNSCKYGCLHLLSCVKVCESNAISVDDDKKIIIDKDKCIACGKCVSVCPHKVIKLIPYNTNYIVKCNSLDKGAAVNKACSLGCIGCKICETKFPDSGIVVTDNLANVVAGGSEESLQAALQACPKKIIKKIN